MRTIQGWVMSHLLDWGKFLTTAIVSDLPWENLPLRRSRSSGGKGQIFYTTALFPWLAKYSRSLLELWLDLTYALGEKPRHLITGLPRFLEAFETFDRAHAFGGLSRTLNPASLECYGGLIAATGALLRQTSLHLEFGQSGYQLKAVKCGASRRTLPLNFFAFRGKPTELNPRLNRFTPIPL